MFSQQVMDEANACHDNVVATKISNKFLPKAIVGDASVLQNHNSTTSDVTTNNNYWIKTSWSYLQMMAGVASLPVSGVNKPRSDEGEIVDLDGSLIYLSTSNNTCNNDILSLNGADEQRSFDSSLFRMKNLMGKTATVDVPAQDDTSTLPSVEGSGYFNSTQEGVHQSLSDPVKMIHAGTESTFIVAYGSSEDDYLKGLGNTSQDAPADMLNIVNFAQRNCDDTSTNEENRKTIFTKRRCLWMVVMLFILTALAFATSEVVSMCWPCRYLGFSHIILTALAFATSEVVSMCWPCRYLGFSHINQDSNQSAANSQQPQTEQVPTINNHVISFPPTTSPALRVPTIPSVPFRLPTIGKMVSLNA
jgi:hypothetical protein